MGKKKAAGTRGAFAECPGGSSGVIHGAAGQHPGGLWLGQVSHSEMIREISLSLDSRRTRGHVACSEGSRRWFTVQALGDRWQARAVSGGIFPKGHSGTCGGSGSIREGRFFARHSGTHGMFRGCFEKGFRGYSRQGFGDIRHIFEGVFWLNLRDTWRVPKEGPKGLFRRHVERGFRRDDFRAGFRDRWHSPKDGPEGASAEASKGGIRQGFGGGFERLRKRGGVFRGHASSSERAPKGGRPGW